MIPDSAIFCNAPWYELQIYWDGSLGFCCQESGKVYSREEQEKYNVHVMSIKQWFDSEPMRRARIMMFDSSTNQICSRCYHEEKISQTSRRHRSNQKSIIFTKSNFSESFIQSPHSPTFLDSSRRQGQYDGLPVDLHIDLGNYCNLACKMCNPAASSKIASQQLVWGVTESEKYIGTDWTTNNTTWHRVLMELADIPKLRNIHFMGGETLITKKFEEFLDFMIERQRFDLNFSFVSNGTIFNEKLLHKLMKFNRVGIEISIETATVHNSYQRQGTDTAQVLEHIQRYLRFCDGNRITLALRPALSLLTIGYYQSLLEFAWNNQIVIKSLLVTDPDYLDVVYLPQEIKQSYLKKYHDLMEKWNLQTVDCENDYNESDPTQFKKIIKNQVLQCIRTLESATPDCADQQHERLVYWCKKWDRIYQYNALELYPELQSLFLAHGY